MYIRMTFQPVEVYELLEPLLQDYRKLRLRNMGKFDFVAASMKLICGVLQAAIR